MVLTMGCGAALTQVGRFERRLYCLLVAITTSPMPTRRAPSYPQRGWRSHLLRLTLLHPVPHLFVDARQHFW